MKRLSSVNKVRLIVCALLGVLSITAPHLVFADICFIHEHLSDEMFLGTKQAELKITYTPENMYVEKQTRFTGDWMKRFFGEVKKERVATYFLMGKDQIRELDWQNRRIYVFEFDKMANIQWIQNRRKNYEAIKEHLDRRYKVKKPELTLEVAPDMERVSGYSCRKITARLRLETVDHSKNASSVTLVDQTLWLSRQVEGYDQYHAFHAQLAKRLGIEAERLGPLTCLLRYWEGSLDPIRSVLQSVSGYTVKTDFLARARYITRKKDGKPKTIEKTIKKETMHLREIKSAQVDQSLFADPEGFEVIRPK
ncbi:MAG: hypothetical protein GY874_14755 [Desulfobacteraceae bacterium]|nr:hypothetical protein [Desulfobacteraceae bacterium]